MVDNNIVRLCELSGIPSSISHKPIVVVTTSDGISLHALHVNTPSDNKKIIIAIHGTASNFYEEPFIDVMTDVLPNSDWAVLSTNNRGHDVLTGWSKRPPGASSEQFEKCLLDIDAWIAYAKKLGYKDIVLQGHSLGAEKVIYYVNEGKYAKDITAIILLGPADSVEYQYKFMKDKGNNLETELLAEAERLVKEKKGQQFLTTYWLSHFGACPQDAASFLDFFKPGSTLGTVLPFKTGKLPMVKNVKVPMLVVIGDIHEYTVIPVEKAMKLLKNENKNCETFILHCNHDFEGKEDKLTAIIKDFLSKKL